MDILPNEQERAVQTAVADFLAAECPALLVREVERSDQGHSRALWRKFAELGWIAACLPTEQGGQGLPLSYLGLILEQAGYHLAPLPLHSTMVAALVIARHGNAAQRALLRDVAAGDLLLSFAVSERSGAWNRDAIRLNGMRDRDDIILSGAKCFVDGFAEADKCLVAFRQQDGSPGLILVDRGAPGISGTDLLPMARDSEALVSFDRVRVPVDNIVGDEKSVRELMDFASIFLVPLMQGATRRALDLALLYVNNRDAFGQPIGSFQAIQHMAADMLIAADGAQLLGREAIWRIDQGLPASVEVSQAKSFASEACLAACRSAQQMHGGMGFIEECDLNLGYRRVVSWGLRGGTAREHRARIAAALLDTPGTVRLGMEQRLPDQLERIDG
jgi:alkylation response protein AidB-like acyl-CoA dehydrogenase